MPRGRTKGKDRGALVDGDTKRCTRGEYLGRGWRWWWSLLRRLGEEWTPDRGGGVDLLDRGGVVLELEFRGKWGRGEG